MGYSFLDLPNYEINFNNLASIPKNNHQRLENMIFINKYLWKCLKYKH